MHTLEPIGKNIEGQYLDLMEECLDKGWIKGDRTGTGTRSLFGRQIRHDMRDGFPLLTTKRVFWKGVAGELLWFISGDTEIHALKEQGIHIWDEWADEKGRLGPVYGAQWRTWQTSYRDANGNIQLGWIDQLQEAIDMIKDNPESRRIIVNAWNVGELNKMALPPCHMMFQFNVRGSYLDLQLYQRSADIFLGVPFNIASYALLLCMVAKLTGKVPGEFIHTFGDVHLYSNHIDQAEQQLARAQRPFPELHIEGYQKDIEEFEFDNFVLTGYDPHPTIKAEVAV